MAGGGGGCDPTCGGGGGCEPTAVGAGGGGGDEALVCDDNGSLTDDIVMDWLPLLAVEVSFIFTASHTPCDWDFSFEGGGISSHVPTDSLSFCREEGAGISSHPPIDSLVLDCVRLFGGGISSQLPLDSLEDDFVVVTSPHPPFSPAETLLRLGGASSGTTGSPHSLVFCLLDFGGPVLFICFNSVKRCREDSKLIIHHIFSLR